MKRVAVDIGGTFTDCFVVWDGSYVQRKALTTHHNLALGFNEALDYACGDLGVSRHELLSEVDSVRYATTLGTNALIERKGPKVGVLVTAGFKSVIPIARGRGYGEGLDISQQMDLPNASRPDALSREARGSSMSRRLGLVNNARPIATLCFSPPDSARTG